MGVEAVWTFRVFLFVISAILILCFFGFGLDFWGVGIIKEVVLTVAIIGIVARALVFFTFWGRYLFLRGLYRRFLNWLCLLLDSIGLGLLLRSFLLRFVILLDLLFLGLIFCFTRQPGLLRIIQLSLSEHRFFLAYNLSFRFVGFVWRTCGILLRFCWRIQWLLIFRWRPWRSLDRWRYAHPSGDWLVRILPLLRATRPERKRLHRMRSIWRWLMHPRTHGRAHHSRICRSAHVVLRT